MKRPPLLLLILVALGAASLALQGCADYDYERPCFEKHFEHALATGDTATLHAGYFDNRVSGCIPFPSSTFRWSTADESVLSVSKEGLIRGVAPGSTQVRITSERDGSATHAEKGIRVIPPVGRVEIRPQRARVSVGDTIQYRVTVYDTSGNVMPGIPSDVRTSRYDLAPYEVGGKVIAEEVGDVQIRSTYLINGGKAVLHISEPDE